MSNIFPIDFEEKLTMAQDDYILFSDSEDGNKIKKAQYKNLKGEKGDTGAKINSASFSGNDIVFGETDGSSVTLSNAKTTLTGPQGNPGTSATITVGTTTTGDAGTSASVTNSGTSSAAVFNFTIPKGADGKDGDAKLFTLSGTSDLTNAQAAYDWYLAGKYPVIKYSSKFYYPYSMGSTNAFWAVPFDKTADSSGTTGLYRDGINMTLSSGTITAIATTTIFVANSNFLRTGVNYGTPYTPEYNGSPATKKYVDDNKFNPGAGTTGQVLTKTADGYEWDDATGGVTSVNGNTGVVTVDEFTPGNTGTTGQVLTKTADGYEYADAPVTSVNGNTGAVTVSEFTPSGTATTGYVVTKTAGGYEWAAPTGGSSTITVTLASANWSSKSITVSATGVTASNTVIVSPAPANINDYATNSVYCSGQGSGTLTFSCNTEPTVDIDVNVLIIN